MATATQTAPSNGAGADDPRALAVAGEHAIADEAAGIRADATELTPELFLKLWPLLRRPIPAGFIQSVGKTQGKPYPSTGVRSVQVLIDRMNNVLTPLWWWDEVSYEDGGTIAYVTVCVGDAATRTSMFDRSSAGGVDRGSTAGNIRKGSYTNAAKRAFAAVGPGHEVYLGTTDLDPDVDEDAAGAQGPTADASTVGTGIAGKLVDRIWKLDTAVKGKLRLAVSHAAKADVGEVNTKAKATKAIAALSYPAAEQLDRWITRKEQGGDDDGD